jgi:hypothetical protein
LLTERYFPAFASALTTTVKELRTGRRSLAALPKLLPLLKVWPEGQGSNKFN